MEDFDLTGPVSVAKLSCWRVTVCIVITNLINADTIAIGQIGYLKVEDLHRGVGRDTPIPHVINTLKSVVLSANFY